MAMTIDPGLVKSKAKKAHAVAPDTKIPPPPSTAMKRLTPSRLTDSDIAAVLAAYGLCVVGMWSVHGG
ncbi:MAG: hypothetical protein F2716_10520, partial [Actinobacteria bacterium]|nr:hypothetical protein [Actinomycetota bacterium]